MAAIATAAVVLWLAAQHMAAASSPLGDGTQIEDRTWDPRLLLAAGVAAAVAMVAAVIVATPRIGSPPSDAPPANSPLPPIE